MAFFSLVFWGLNWLCWRRKLCCFKVFDEFSDKVLVWWLSWVFFCGILACIISGFVSANRLGFALNGIQCAYERIYYDSVNGQMKDSYPKWEGFKNVNDTIDLLSNIVPPVTKTDLDSLKNKFYFNEEEINETIVENINFIYPVETAFAEKIVEIAKSSEDEIKTINGDLNEINRIMFSTIINYIQFISNSFIISNTEKISKQIKEIKFILNFDSDLKEYKTKFMPELEYLINVGKAFFKILPIIYFSLLLFFVVGSGALLITYYCKKVNQQWWILPMHIAWNGVRFFIISFFMYGFGYGMLDYYSRDLIALSQFTFGRENIEKTEKGPDIIPKVTKNFFQYCLFSKPNISDVFSNYNNALVEFLRNVAVLENFKANIPQPSSSITGINQAFSNLIQTMTGWIQKDLDNVYEKNLTSLITIINRDGNIYENLDCGFLNSTLNVMYRAIWDFSWESRNLCALSCCIAFFGIIAVYSFLWVMELWKKEGGDIPSKKNYNDYSKFNDTNKKKKRAGIKPPPNYQNDNEDNEDGSGSELQQYDN